MSGYNGYCCISYPLGTTAVMRLSQKVKLYDVLRVFTLNTKNVIGIHKINKVMLSQVKPV